jgi:hypothetical protein
MLGPSDAVTRFRTNEATHEKAARMSTATSTLGTKPRTWFTMPLTAVRFTAFAAIRMTMSRRYHFTNPAMTPAASVSTRARRRKFETPARSAAVSKRTARNPRATSPARAPVMIQPRSRMTSAARIAGIAAKSATRPAARPVRSAEGRSVIGAIFGYSLSDPDVMAWGRLARAAATAPASGRRGREQATARAQLRDERAAARSARTPRSRPQ